MEQAAWISYAAVWTLIALNTAILGAVLRALRRRLPRSGPDRKAPGAAPSTAGTSRLLAGQPASNPWMPWVDPGPRPPVPDAGGILAVIPTAGRDPDGLRRCLEALYTAAAPAEGLSRSPLHPVVVVCPATAETEGAVRSVCGTRARVVPLPGPFNYPRSVNAGLAARSAGDGYTLLLNDDCFFTRAGDLLRLKQTLREQHWACVGPWLWESERTPVPSPRGSAPRLLSEPVVGACALWSFEWLGRAGTYDERFGEGYGHDESDQSLRVLRLGAAWGREEGVVAVHLPHTTFGHEAVQPETELYQRNVRHWERKWGNVGRWGEGVPWQPLPGVQVAIAGHNVEEWLPRCLETIERALDGFRWVLTYADDASTDRSFDNARRHATGADYCVLGRFPKAANAGQAKNRAIELGRQFQPAYPALCLMDADDEMPPERIRHLLWQARDGGHPVVHGAYQVIDPGGPDDGRSFGPTDTQQAGAWLSPCTTIIHWSLVPPDGRLFAEDLGAMEDAELFLRWYLAGIRSVPCPGPVVHRYHYRRGSVMRAADSERHFQAWEHRRDALLALAP